MLSNRCKVSGKIPILCVVFQFFFFCVLDTTQKLASVASGVAIEPVFEKTLNKTHNFYLNPTELSKLNSYRQKELKKRRDRKLLMLGLPPDPSFLTKKESTTQVVSKNSKSKHDN